MTDPVRASIIIVSFNSASDLPDCLASLKRTLGPDDEVIVFDNASNDESIRIARNSDIRVDYSPTNVGFAAGCNRGAALARGRCLIFLNPDTVVEDGWIDPLIAPLLDGPGMSTAKILLMHDPTRIDTCANQVHRSGITVCRGHGRSADLFDHRERVLAVSGAAFAIDTATFRQLGGFDERFFMYLEDTDLSMRAALAGVPCWFVPESRVRHRHRPSFNPGKMYWLERNRWLMQAKIWTPRTFLALLPFLMVVEALTWTDALLGGHRSVVARARATVWLLQHPWALFARRSSTQKRRVVADEALLNAQTWRLDMTELISPHHLRRMWPRYSRFPCFRSANSGSDLSLGQFVIERRVISRNPLPGKCGRPREAIPT